MYFTTIDFIDKLAFARGIACVLYFFYVIDSYSVSSMTAEYFFI